MLVPLNPNVDEYVVSWSWTDPKANPNPSDPWTFTATGGPHGSGSGPYGEEQWSTTALTPANTGVNVNYQVPSGLGAWFVAAGGGPGPCEKTTGVAQGWALTYKREISGHITVQGSGGLPAPGVTVDANCPGGGTTTTDQDGRYEFLVDKGSCTVAPQLKSGDVATPQQRVVDVSGGSRYGVDFLVPCDAVVVSATDSQLKEAGRLPAAEPLGSLRYASTSLSHICPLAVSVKQLEPLRSGLAIHSQPYPYYPVDFVTSGKRLTCESGCTDLLVSVVDPLTNKGVPYANVTASINAGDTYDGAAYIGRNWLCTVSTEGLTKDCGASVAAQTGSDGKLYLRYWTSGVIATSLGTYLRVTATKDSCSSTCSQKKGTLKPPMPLTVAPYLVYDKYAPIPETDAEDMAAWAEGLTSFQRFLNKSSWAALLGTKLLKWLEKQELVAESVVEGAEKAEPIIAIPAHVLQIGSELWDMYVMTAMFLNLTDLNYIGLAAPPSEASASGWPSLNFTNDLVNFGTVLPTRVGADGVWFQIAKELQGAKFGDQTYNNLADFAVELKVYEVSHCETGDTCEPGYRNDPGSASVKRPGIQPDLAIDVTLMYKGGATVAHYRFEVGYDAIAWSEHQHDLDTSLPGTNPSPPVAAAAGTVSNGGFSQPVVSAALMYQGYPAGSTAIPGWTIGGDGVEVYASGFMQHPAGTTSEVRLFGGAPGSISQAIATTPGKTYVLKWYGAGEPGGGQAVKTMHVFWDGKLVAAPTFDTTGRSFTDMGWKALRVTVMATSPTSTIEFTDATPDKSFWGSMVTGVSLRASP